MTFSDLLKNWKLWITLIIIGFVIMYFIWGGKRDYKVEGLNFLRADYIPEEIPPPRREITPPPPPYSQIENARSAPEFNVNYGSRGEEYTCRALGNILHTEIKNGERPSILRNPYTGRNLELDCWAVNQGIACEYNGIQHYEYTPKFHNNYDKFLTQVRNDKVKEELCRRNNIKLIIIPYTVDTTIPTQDGIKPKKFTPQERYKRIQDYLCHHLPYISQYGTYNPNPHYTTHYIPPQE